MPWRSAPGSPPVPLVVDFSDVYKQVNPCGKAQKVVVLLCASTWAANAIGFALPIFIGQSAHRVVVGCGEALRCTVGEVLERQDRCEDDVRWEVAHEHSLASEWDLTCDRESMLPVAGTAFFFGNLFGNLVLSTLMDRWGRVPCSCLFSCIATAFGVLSALSPSFFVYVVARFGLGVAQVTCGSSAWLLSCEVTTTTHSSNTMIAMNTAWAIGLTAIVPVAFVVPSWRPLTWIHVLIFSVISCIWFVAWMSGLDSPVWLAGKGDEEGFNQAINAMARANGTVFVVERDSEAEESVAGKSTACATAALDAEPAVDPVTLCTVLCACPSVCQVLVFALSFSSCSLGYYGLAMNAGNIGNNLYMSAVFTALAELPGVWAAKPLMDSVLLGRRGTLFSGTLLSGLFSLVSSTLAADAASVVVVSVLGKTCVTAAYCVVFVHSCESFPPQVRGLLLGVCQTASRLTGLLVPTVVFFPHPWPAVFIGSFLVVSAFPLLVLPETRAVPEGGPCSRNYSNFTDDYSDKVDGLETVVGNPTLEAT